MSNSQVFTGLVEIERLNIGGSSSYEAPKIDTQLILNGDFSNPSLSTNFIVTPNLQNWIVDGTDNYITLNKNNNLENGFSQYIGLTYLNGLLKQTITINNTGNYNISFYLNKGLGSSVIQVLLSNNLINKTIDWII
jgi:hypothetical protein